MKRYLNWMGLFSFLIKEKKKIKINKILPDWLSDTLLDMFGSNFGGFIIYSSSYSSFRSHLFWWSPAVCLWHFLFQIQLLLFFCYADDTLLYVSSKPMSSHQPSSLSASSKEAESWFTPFSFKRNGDKTEVVLRCSTSTPSSPPSWRTPVSPRRQVAHWVSFTTEPGHSKCKLTTWLDPRTSDKTSAFSVRDLLSMTVLVWVLREKAFWMAVLDADCSDQWVSSPLMHCSLSTSITWWAKMWRNHSWCQQPLRTFHPFSKQQHTVLRDWCWMMCKVKMKTKTTAI